MTIDTTLNIEAVIAALGVLGAAVGYLINLIQKWHENHKDRKYRGTNFVILDLLEKNFYEGLSEDRLWELYNSEDTKEQRRSFGAYRPAKLERLGFEGQLKHLQNNFLIRLTGKGHYHIDFQERWRWTEAERIGTYKNIVDKVSAGFKGGELTEILNSALTNQDTYAHTRKDLHHFLASKGDNNNVKLLIEDLKSSDQNKVKNAIETFLLIYRESSR